MSSIKQPDTPLDHNFHARNTLVHKTGEHWRTSYPGYATHLPMHAFTYANVLTYKKAQPPPARAIPYYAPDTIGTYFSPRVVIKETSNILTAPVDASRVEDSRLCITVAPTISGCICVFCEHRFILPVRSADNVELHFAEHSDTTACGDYCRNCHRPSGIMRLADIDEQNIAIIRCEIAAMLNAHKLRNLSAGSKLEDFSAL